MKIYVPLKPLKENEFPSYVNWFLSNILVPYPLYIITSIDRNGVPNAQPNSWGFLTVPET